MAQLPPSPQALGIFNNYIAHQSESLVLKERVLSLSGDSFSIKTLDGRDMLQVKGEAFSLSGRKTVMDMQGNHIFTIRKEHFSFPRAYYAEDAQGKRFFELQGKFSLGSSKSIGRFINSFTNQQEELLMKGNFFDTYADITNVKTGQPVARIDRKMLNARELFTGQQTYVVTVAQGVDLALITAMCICLDEKRNDK
ncbi:hypothetical protein GJ744_004309 [Endocarpon pusillum]|uniref:DUF567-domain-containing protein n=1 Tax=Endocarpon pusillum TaxID=364733 RepID=A0A8H7A5N1_9EURO|nr:hypothetical protein GJ744_004309 [Endocarpon pusillum]